MNTGSIQEALKILLSHSKKKIPYFVIAADEIQTVLDYDRYPVAVVQNTDLLEDEGEHWISFYMEKHDEYEYLDSFGNDISVYRNVTTPRANIVRENCSSLQSARSFVCGNYCVNFLYSRAIDLSFEDFLNKFRNNVHHNDALMRKFIANIPNLVMNGNYFCGKKIQANKCKEECPHFTLRRW